MVPDGNVDLCKVMMSSRNGHSKYKKIHSVSLVIQEMQPKTILRYYFLPIKMAIIKEKM